MTQQPAIVGRHSRALRILTCLQSGPGFNAQELANQMMVSRRTIFRDLNLIRNAGVSRSVPLPRFQEEDLMKLVLVVQLTYLNGFEDYVQAVREILARLLAGYPQETKDRIARIIHGCTVVETGITYEGLTREMIKAVFESISRQQQIRMLVVENRWNSFSISPWKDQQSGPSLHPTRSC